MKKPIDDFYELLRDCTICPRNCKVNRFIKSNGYCRTGVQMPIASIFNHRGEEPVIMGKNGICNIFFAHCNLQCVYCQNFQISNNKISIENYTNIEREEIISIIIHYLKQGCEAVGFVSPGHVIPQMIDIICLLRKKGYRPIVIYNSNGYDKVETLKMIEEYVDVYLPDFKYINSFYSEKYSGSKDYPEVVKSALKEMFRQKGSNLIINDNGQAIFGIVIRHLVLPGLADESIEILKWIAENLSNNIYLSLMSQYYPPKGLNLSQEIDKTITFEEYEKVKNAMIDLGFINGWIQELSSNEYYRPDFNNYKPFED